jgi:nucleoid-associated protein YgaU
MRRLPSKEAGVGCLPIAQGVPGSVPQGDRASRAACASRAGNGQAAQDAQGPSRTSAWRGVTRREGVRMGNFEKLSVVVIVVIIVMILAVAVVEWTSSPSETPVAEPGTEKADAPPVLPPEPVRTDKPKKPSASKPAPATDVEPQDAPWGPWIGFKDDKGAKTDKTEPKSALPGDKGEIEKKVEPAPAPVTTTPDIAETTHVVVDGDMLSTISMKYYGKASLWTAIAEANPGVRPDALRKGDTLKIPARKGMAVSPTPGGGGSGSKPVPGKEYTVQANDTWERISLAAYNTSARWPEIYVKNIDRVDNMKDLPKGKVLLIPK